MSLALRVEYGVRVVIATVWPECTLRMHLPTRTAPTEECKGAPMQSQWDMRKHNAGTYTIYPETQTGISLSLGSVWVPE